jgi:hypothetical protein
MFEPEPPLRILPLVEHSLFAKPLFLESRLRPRRLGFIQLQQMSYNPSGLHNQR